MRIRPEQILGLQDAADMEFHRRLAAFIRHQHEPVSNLGDAALMKQIRASVESARTYGLTWQSSLASFVSLAFEFGSEFHKHPAAQRILTDPSIPSNFRISQLVNFLDENTWKEIEETRRTV